MPTLRAVGAADAHALGDAARLATLEDVLAWALPLGHEVAEVIVQDEYTHDVVVRAAAAYLVFDTT
jgi:hypothetical protein